MSISEQALRESVAGGYRTLADIGSDFGVTRERIRQLCNRYSIERGRPELTPPYAYRSRWPREGIPALKRRIGLCRYNGCYAQLMPNRVQCAEHLQVQARRATRYHTAQRARGLCYHCDELPVPSHTLCQRHLDMLRDHARSDYPNRAPGLKARRDARKTAYSCVQCGEPARSGRVMCERCSLAAASNKRDRRLAEKAAA